VICHVYHLPLRSGFKIKRGWQKVATVARFDNKLVESLGLVFFFFRGSKPLK